jgi:hypothetical protein
MNRCVPTAVALVTGISALTTAPVALADESVMYEVVSGYIRTANVDYLDGGQPVSLKGVSLPWRGYATVVDPYSESTDGPRLHADWLKASSGPSWATIRIYFRGSLLCQQSLQVSNQSPTAVTAACYGDTPAIDGNRIPSLPMPYVPAPGAPPGSDSSAR